MRARARLRFVRKCVEKPAVTAVFMICTTIVLAESLRPSEALILRVRTEFGNAAAERVVAWQALMDKAPTANRRTQLEGVNRFFNKVPFVSDLAHWGQEDYWATPLELLVSNGGDCEDFSIAKYFTLRSLGVPAENLRLIYAKATLINQAHMVLAFYETPASDPLILDNLDPVIKPGSQRTDLIPVYSFNGEHVWLAKELKGRGEMVGNASRISLWKKLRQRVDHEMRAAQN